MLGGVALFSISTDQAALSSNGVRVNSFSDCRSTNLRKKYSSTQLHFKFPGIKAHLFQFLANKGGSLARNTIVCTTSKEKDDADKKDSDHYIYHPVVVDPKEDGGSLGSEMETIFSLMQCPEPIPGCDESRGREDSLLDKLIAAHLHVQAMEQWNAFRIKASHKKYVVSATNLIHYLALKSLDMKQFEEQLSSIGLLNLDTINPHVLASLSAVLRLLGDLKSGSSSTRTSSGEEIFTGQSLDKLMGREFPISKLRKKASQSTEMLLGRLPEKRGTHIMVTVGQEAIESETLVDDLIASGATIVRINCAHGNPEIWSEIIRRVKRSSKILEKPCRILMDLAGPKLRTGKLKAGPCVVKISSKRDAFGNVICPARIWLSSPGTGPPPAHASPDAILYVDSEEFLDKLEVNDVVRLSDARGKQRKLKILSRFPVFSGIGFMAECNETAYVESGTVLNVKDKKRKFSAGFVVNVPPVEQFVRLRVGDLLTISRDSQNEENNLSCSSVGAHWITCSSGYLFDSVKPGEPIAFDDGKIWGIIKATSMSEIVVSITHAGPKGTKLGSEKSINIPESSILYEGLTSKDLMDLNFVVNHADMVGVSFIRDVCDILLLRQELEKRKKRDLGVVLKIETKGGFEKLPLILLDAMKMPNPLGVMVARGDLAVECGWENLADIQEEIMSICAAAHVPVIWATQVLESLIKSGVPTRAELTDVAKGRRTSCIMLNKGNCIVEAVSTLHNILSDHPRKGNAELKPCSLSNQGS